MWSKLHSKAVVIRKYTNSACKMRHNWQNIFSITGYTEETNCYAPKVCVIYLGLELLELYDGLLCKNEIITADMTANSNNFIHCSHL